MEAEIEPVSTGPKKGAGTGIRILARLIDWLIMNLLSLTTSNLISLIYVVVLTIAGGHEPRIPVAFSGSTPSIIAVFRGFVISILGISIYCGLCEGLHGATLGKLICGLRVLKADGSACSLRPAFIRSLALAVDLLFFGIIGIERMSRSARHRRWGDKWADTIVVKVRDHPGYAAPPHPFWLAFPVALAASGWFFGIYFTWIWVSA